MGRRGNLLACVNAHLSARRSNMTLHRIFLSDGLIFDGPRSHLFTKRVSHVSHFTLHCHTHGCSDRRFHVPCDNLHNRHADLVPRRLGVTRSINHHRTPHILLTSRINLKGAVRTKVVLRRRLLSNTTRHILVVIPRALRRR